MPLARVQAFGRLPAGDTRAQASFLKQGINRAQYEAATAIYRALASDLHSLGWRVQITTLNPVVDD